MVEHLVCNQAVVGSSPVASTNREGFVTEWAIQNSPRSLSVGFFENKVNRMKRGNHS